MLHVDERKVGIGLWCVSTLSLSLLNILLGCGLVTLVESHDSHVVEGAVVLVIQFCCLLIDSFLLGRIALQRSGIEQLIRRQTGRIGSVLLLDLVVASSHSLVVDDHATTAQLRQNAIGELTEALAHVADLALTLLGILIHLQDAQDHVLVLDVAGFDETLEAVPVLSRIVGIDILGIEFGSLDLLLDISLSSVLAFVGQLVVEGIAAIRRSISLHLHVLQVQALAVGIDSLQHGEELLDGVVLQLALAEIGLVDEELDIGFILLCFDALERVRCNASASVHQRLLVELCCSQHAIGDLHGRHIDFLLADTGIEGEIHLALLHIGHIVKGCLHRVAATHLVGNGLVVAHDFLALEGSAFALSDLSIAIAQLRDHRHHSFRLHIFHGEVTIDGSRNLAA